MWDWRLLGLALPVLLVARALNIGLVSACANAWPGPTCAHAAEHGKCGRPTFQKVCAMTCKACGLANQSRPVAGAGSALAMPPPPRMGGAEGRSIKQVFTNDVRRRRASAQRGSVSTLRVPSRPSSFVTILRACGSRASSSSRFEA